MTCPLPNHESKAFRLSKPSCAMNAGKVLLLTDGCSSGRAVNPEGYSRRFRVTKHTSAIEARL